MSIIKRITSAGLSLAMAATVIPSSFAVSAKSASTLSSVTAKYLDAENGKEIAEKQTYSVTHEEKSPQTITNYTYADYTESVEYVYSHKDLTYIIGYSDKGVHPNGDLTRAEAAMIFYRLYDGDYPSFTRRMSNSTFKDVSAKNWFYEPVETLYNIGLLEGKSKDTFAPNAPISRAEFAVLAARFRVLVAYFAAVKTSELHLRDALLEGVLVAEIPHIIIGPADRADTQSYFLRI